MAQLAHIVRHPIKSIGYEVLDSVTLTPGACLPYDRRWAVLHERSKVEDGTWGPKANYLRGVSAPELMAVQAHLDATDMSITLRHPARPDLTFNPTRDAEALLDWVGPLWPSETQRPTRVVKGDQALTDVAPPWISLASHASLEALAAKMGLPDLSMHRFRANLWIEGLEPWAEWDWVGREIQIGATRLKIVERITRCKATMGNPETGKRDADTLAALNDSYGHQDFGLYAEVLEGGEIAPGADVTV